jgi:hypothetical protein
MADHSLFLEICISRYLNMHQVQFWPGGKALAERRGKCRLRSFLCFFRIHAYSPPRKAIYRTYRLNIFKFLSPYGAVLLNVVTKLYLRVPSLRSSTVFKYVLLLYIIPLEADY